MGSPKGRESYGDGGPVVVAGVTTCRGGRENLPQGEGGQVTRTLNSREVCEMQNAETVLGVLRERGRRGLPCNELYRQLFNPNLYLMAYGRLYSNQGAMTPGVYGETADGMSFSKIEGIIRSMKGETYSFTPAKRTYIPKKDGKMRPLGLPSWSDKFVGEVVRLLLESYYEPQFSARSHGFRPQRGCHTALLDIQNNWTGTTWFIEGDIADCFGSMDHGVLIRILGEKIHDNRFLRLIHKMLKAGYIEDWEYHSTLSGAPQGGVASPILSNIYLDRLDSYVEKVLLPQNTRGKSRRRNPDYHKVENKINRLKKSHARHEMKGELGQFRSLRKELRRLPSGDTQDPGYRRLRYIRYADDHLLGFIGPRSEAEQVKHQLAKFLRDELHLELSEEKTLITHARSQRARFLGYEISTMRCDRKISHGRRDRKRASNGKIRLHVPRAVIREKCAPYYSSGKPAYLPHLTSLDDHDIVTRYGVQYRGIVQYYLLAGDVFKLERLKGVMLTSMLKTLAAKHRSTVTKMARRFATTIETPRGKRRCFEAEKQRPGRKSLVARFGGIPLVRDRKVTINDRPPAPLSRKRGKQLIERIRSRRCELCEDRTEVQVHQVRNLAEIRALPNPKPEWAQVMQRMYRKTLVVCTSCHAEVHGSMLAAKHAE
ncbi:Mobile element protein [Nocardiopsis sp. JB363]|nr:Mobile element protein [Nocardiopsis sp. JB363]